LEQPVDRASFVGLDDRDPQSGRQHLDNEGVVEQAAIAAGSAFIGSIVGGCFALLAGRQQWKNSLESRSHEAAARVVNAILAVSQAWVSLEGSGNLQELVVAANGFTAAATAELPFVRDGEVVERVRNHIEVTFFVVSSMRNGLHPPEGLINALNKHQGIVIATLEAHIKGDSLPDCDPLPVGSVLGLVRWGKGP
jgi:hypothetical protein